MKTPAKFCFILPALSVVLLTLATGEQPTLQADHIGYDFQAWGGKKRTTFGTFHWNLDLARLLGKDYSVVSRFGRERAAKGAPWAFYDEVSFTRNKDAMERPKDTGTVVYKIRYYECKNLLLAHKTLISTMCSGSAPSPPNRCIRGVDVGDKCFTGWAKEIPTSIFLARGNVVFSITGRDSVLPIAIGIDKKLTEGFPRANRPNSVTFPRSNRKEGAALPETPRTTRVTAITDEGDVSTSVWCSIGNLQLGDRGNVMLTGITGGDVEVVVIKAHRLRFRPRRATP